MFDLRIKDLFFDRQKVIRAVDQATRKALAKAGAFIRQRAKTSIRKRQGPARAGDPPHSHVGLLKKFLFFGYDPASKSVVIGPARLARSTDAPHTLEFGGAAGRPRQLRIGRVGPLLREAYGRVRYGLLRSSAQVARAQEIEAERARARIAPRPYMGPALEKERPNLPRQWADSVRGG